MLARLQKLLDKFIWGTHLSKLGMPARLLAMLLRYVYALTRDILSGQITLRAMSLVYTTLLSVVPLLAFSFSVLKGFGKHKDLEPYLYNFLLPLGDRGVEITNQIIALVDNVKGGLLGGISLAFFIYTAVSMVQKMEDSFNYVWHVDKPRSLARRFSEYFSVLLIGPVVMTIAMGMIASIRSNRITQMLLENEYFGAPIVFATELTPYVLVAAVFTFLYTFMPNTKVNFKSAVIGGLTAGIIWASTSAFFATFVVYSTRNQLIYSGFAVAITALIWLYLNWLILLLGAQIAFYHQHPAFLRIGRREPRLSNSMRERLALNIMFTVGCAFRNSDKTITVDQLSKNLEIPTIALSPIIAALEDQGILITTEAEVLLPGREMARIKVSDILEPVRRHGETGSYKDPTWDKKVNEICGAIEAAINEVIMNKSLADLIDEETES